MCTKYEKSQEVETMFRLETDGKLTIKILETELTLHWFFLLTSIDVEIEHKSTAIVWGIEGKKNSGRQQKRIKFFFFIKMSFCDSNPWRMGGNV